jgi:hypothetical protein
MWIKWKYVDHCWPDFKELEIPDDFGGYETVEEYLCDHTELGIPTWSERFMMERIKWEKLELPPAEVKARKITTLKNRLSSIEKELDRIKKELEKELK